MIGLVSIIIVLAVVGFITWLVITMIPMPDPFPRVIVAIVCLLVLLWLLAQLSGELALPLKLK